MSGYNYDTIRFEAQHHMSRLAHEAAAERLADKPDSTQVDGVRWLRRVSRGWAVRLIHPGARAPIAARPA